MFRLKAFLVVTLFLVSLLGAEYIKADQTRTVEGVWYVVHGVDMMQTLDISRNCDSLHESNVFLGDCPEPEVIIPYFLLTAALHTGVTYTLPKKYRGVFQGMTLWGSLGTTINNHKIGLQVRF